MQGGRMTLTVTSRPRRSRQRATPKAAAPGPRGLGWTFAAEVLASAMGFAALIHQARALGPIPFARVEYAVAVAAWLLVLVRGGVDEIVYREAARRVRLVAPLTNLLLGLRFVSAVVGYGLVRVIAASVGPEKGRFVAIAGLTLFVSTWVADVGPRATGRLGWVALAQVSRGIGFAGAVFGLLRGPADAMVAVVCLLLGETIYAAVTLAVHCRFYGFPRMRWRRRASCVLARRGAIAGLTRFVRVTLYGADLLALGWWAGLDLGRYAAARRIVFALVAIGLVWPAALAPSLARAWALGRETARQRIADGLSKLWMLSLPAAVGLGLTAERWMPALFGESYRGGGPWLALTAARLPWLLAVSFTQVALVACRREGLSLRLAIGQLVLCVLLVPASAVAAGPWGVGWASLVIEMTGAVASWVMLARLGVAIGWTEQVGRALAGCLGLLAACVLTKGMPLPVVTIAGAGFYAMAWKGAARLPWIGNHTGVSHH